MGPGVVCNVTKIALERIPSVSVKVVNSFIKQRTFIRIKFLIASMTKKRKGRDDICDWKKNKKYKKLVP